MGEKLAVRFSVTVGEWTFRNGGDPDAPGHPSSLEIRHVDQEASSLILTVKDFNLESDLPFEVFNSIPNPRLNESISVEASIGWEGETPVPAFQGILVDKVARYQPSRTELMGAHESFKLRKRGRVVTLHNLTMRQALTNRAAEEGIVLQFHSSIAGDAILNTPVEAFMQVAEANWAVIRRWLVSFGYITNTVRRNVIVVRRDKSSETQVLVKRGGEDIVSFSVKETQKRDGRSGRRKGHTHETKAGRRWSRFFPEAGDTSRHVTPVKPPVGREAKQHKVPMARESARGKAKRRTVEGDEIELVIRLRPEMLNEEVVVMSGFGPQIDGAWQTREVTHRLGNTLGQTDIKAWRP